jgi:two-component system cell cycle response regulator DivK
MAADDSPAASWTVLLAEPDDDARELYRFYLGTRGWCMWFAESGDQVMRIAVRERPDAIVMELSLPVIDGWELMRQLPSDARTVGVPVLVLSAPGVPRERERALDAGAAAYLRKPCLPEVLERELLRVLGDRPPIVPGEGECGRHGARV